MTNAKTFRIDGENLPPFIIPQESNIRNKIEKGDIVKIDCPDGSTQRLQFLGWKNNKTIMKYRVIKLQRIVEDE